VERTGGDARARSRLNAAITSPRALAPHAEEHLSFRSNWLRAAVLGANDGILSTSIRPPKPARPAAAGAAGGLPVEVDQGDGAGARRDPAERQVVAVAGTEDRDPRALLQEGIEEPPEPVAGRRPATAPVDLGAGVAEELATSWGRGYAARRGSPGRCRGSSRR
jgi:hypothetical protein